MKLGLYIFNRHFWGCRFNGDIVQSLNFVKCILCRIYTFLILGLFFVSGCRISRRSVSRYLFFQRRHFFHTLFVVVYSTLVFFGDNFGKIEFRAICLHKPEQRAECVFGNPKRFGGRLHIESFRKLELSRFIIESMSSFYKIVGGTRFYDRTEIKDIISYMELVANRDDDLRLKRIINKPSRKIGDTTINAIQDIAQGLGVSMFEVCMNAGDYPVLSRAAKSIKGFCDVYENLDK